MTASVEAPSLLSADPADAELDRVPFLAGVRAHARERLAPAALETDRSGVTAGDVATLRALGAFTHGVPQSLGGLGADAAVDRRAQEWIAYGDLNTWLVWTQHVASVPRLLALGAARGGLGPLGTRSVRGEALLGAGLSDVRGFPERFVRATRTTGGWSLDGTISWVSGWGLNDVLHVAAVEPSTSTVVIGLIPVDDRTVGAPLDLQAVRGSRTWRVELRSALLAHEEVLVTLPWAEWDAADRANSGDAHAGLFGLAFRVLDELDGSGDEAREVAVSWLPVIERLRRRAYRLTDENRAAGVLGHRAQERAETKQQALTALDAVTDALLTVRAGRGLTADDTAQLHSRAALFLRVQSQTRAARERRLRHLAALAPRDG